MVSIVLADDEKMIVDTIREVLESAVRGLRIDGVFYDGKSLLDHLSRRHADIVLADIEMPGASGIEILRWLRANHRSSRVVMITAYHRFDYALSAIDHHADAFLTKPFSSQKLIDTVREAMAAVEGTRREDDWLLSRQRIRALCSPEGGDAEDILLCRGTAPLRALRCHEIRLRLDAPQAERGWTERLCECLECDSVEASVVFLEAHGDTAVFLALGGADLDAANCARALEARLLQTADLRAQSSLAACDSFDAYLRRTRFARQTEEFFRVLESDGLEPAKARLSLALRQMPPTERAAYVDFLRQRFSLPEGVGAREEGISALTDALVGRALGRSDNHLACAAKEYVDQHFDSSALSLRAVADELRISDVYLSRLFKKETGFGFAEYCQHVRMEKAGELVRGTHLSTGEIAAAVGYNDPAYFRRAFKRRFGLTPQKLRQIARRKDDPQ